MAKRKSSRKKPKPKKSRKKISLRITLLRALAGLSILVLLVAGTGLLVYFLVPPKQPPKPLPPKEPPWVKQNRVPEKPVFEIYPKVNVPSGRPIARPETPPENLLPKVAIIIDDLGYDKRIAEKFLELDAVFTFSILPYSPFLEKIDRLARDKGIEIILHLPMDPVEYPNVNPGPATLLTSMSADELISQLEMNLNALPSAKGVNNHMGSKMTADSNHMYQIFFILKKRGLFFIDSRTTAATYGKSSAKLFKVPFAQRDVFIDHLQGPDLIRRQINDLVDIAERHGEAIGIAHPHSTTFEILQEMLPELQKKVQLVPASRIVRVIG